MQVRLDVPRNFTPVHGKVYVSINVRREGNSADPTMRSIYVDPEDLLIPDGNQADMAHSFFYV
jgi:hypothetical protein